MDRLRVVERRGGVSLFLLLELCLLKRYTEKKHHENDLQISVIILLTDTRHINPLYPPLKKNKNHLNNYELVVKKKSKESLKRSNSYLHGTVLGAQTRRSRSRGLKQILRSIRT